MGEVNQTAVTSTEDILLQRIRQVAAMNKGKEGNLIQVLHMVQGVYGYLPLEVQEIVSIELGIPLAEVSGVASFYSFFSTQPRGRHTIRICLGTACYVRGGVTIVDTLEKNLGVGIGQTTKDGMFSFEVARCIGSCGLAPAMSIDAVVYPHVKPDEVSGILQSWYKKDEEEGVI